MNGERKCGTCNGIFSLKKKEILNYVNTWMDLEDIRLSEISQTQDKHSMIPLI